MSNARQCGAASSRIAQPQATVSNTLEPITRVADCLDVRRVAWIVLDFRAQCRYASIHTAVVDHDFGAPHAIENLVAGQRATGTFRKEFQEPELFRGKVDLLAGPEQFV